MDKRDINILKNRIIDLYCDEWGFLDYNAIFDSSGNLLSTSGNGMLYQSQILVALKELNAIDNTDIARYKRSISSVKIEEGLYRRHPTNDGLEQHDNIVGMAVGCYFLGIKDICKSLYNYGQSNRFLWFLPYTLYSYNSVNPKDKKLNTLLLPHHCFIINYCAGKYWGILNTIWFIIATIISSYSKHKTGTINSGVRLLMYTMLKPVKNKIFFKYLFKKYIKKADIFECIIRYYKAESPFSKVLIIALNKELAGS